MYVHSKGPHISYAEYLYLDVFHDRIFIPCNAKETLRDAVLTKNQNQKLINLIINYNP